MSLRIRRAVPLRLMNWFVELLLGSGGPVWRILGCEVVDSAEALKSGYGLLPSIEVVPGCLGFSMILDK